MSAVFAASSTRLRRWTIAETHPGLGDQEGEADQDRRGREVAELLGRDEARQDDVDAERERLGRAKAQTAQAVASEHGRSKAAGS